MKFYVFTYLFVLCFIGQFSFAQYEGYSPMRWKNQLQIEEDFLKQINSTSFKTHLKKLTERPHVVGSEANAEVQRYMSEVMQQAGFEVTQYPYDLYLPNQPGSSPVS
jgi:N-acetylated-alpha-linked acidic dipeptidase